MMRTTGGQQRFSVVRICDLAEALASLWDFSRTIRPVGGSCEP